jgi:membrane protein DedA with SNARE-associated domain
MGLSKFDIKRFGILNLFASGLWAVIVGYGSYAAGKPLTAAYETVADKPYLAPVILLFFAGLIWWYMSFATKRR